MSDMTFHKNGTVTLPSNADPAAYGTYVQGWLRHSIGVDLGRNDPTALVVIRDECYPEFTGRGFEQRLGQRRRTVVHHETVKMTGDLTIASDLPDRGLLDREIGSFELTSTSAGNLTLAGGGKGHHADRAIALALAYLKTTHLENRTMSFGKLQGYWG